MPTMLSRTYTPAPPLPLLDDLADELPVKLPDEPHPGHRLSIADIALSNLDPHTSRLLAAPTPARRRHHHHVRVQGRLALVRSVSTTNLRAPTTGKISPVPPVSSFEHGVGSGATTKSRRRGDGRDRGRRKSLDGSTRAESELESDDEERVRETAGSG